MTQYYNSGSRLKQCMCMSDHHTESKLCTRSFRTFASWLIPHSTERTKVFGWLPVLSKSNIYNSMTNRYIQCTGTSSSNSLQSKCVSTNDHVHKDLEVAPNHNITCPNSEQVCALIIGISSVLRKDACLFLERLHNHRRPSTIASLRVAKTPSIMILYWA